ncbi:NADH-quinone oxidoreductase subunit A [Aquihabitans sp. G128]|nr:NADH-quinone oxidoreductase subunit A [Aquihabitans sp. G128]
MGQYLPVLVMLALGAGFAGVSLVMSKLVSPKRPSAAKSAPYECGIVPRNEPPERFPVRFYLVAMIFIVFDIEIIFLYPYAVIYRQLGGFGLVEMLVFAIAVFASFIYLISNGALDWGPVQALRSRANPAVSPNRTTASTIRRVGADGRPADAPEEVAA